LAEHEDAPSLTRDQLRKELLAGIDALRAHVAGMRGFEISRSTLTDLLGIPQGEASKLKNNTSTRDSAWLQEKLGYLSALACALAFFETRKGLESAGGKATLAPWLARPFRRVEGISEVTRYLVEQCLGREKGLADSAEPPIMHVSPIKLENVRAILEGAQQQLSEEKGMAEYPLRRIVGGVELKLTHPSLLHWLEANRCTSGDLYEKTLQNAQRIADLAGTPPPRDLNPRKEGFIAVKHLWAWAPLFHALYITGAKWMHVGPWISDMNGKLNPWAISSFRIDEGLDKEVFQEYKKALTDEGPKRDWSWLDKARPYTAPPTRAGDPEEPAAAGKITVEKNGGIHKHYAKGRGGRTRR
jgi:hypothetical protein